MTVERHGSERQLTIPVTRACAFAIELGNADNVNAYADGPRVLVTRGMIDFTRSDDELAFVLATAMAHNMLGHAGHAAQRRHHRQHHRQPQERHARHLDADRQRRHQGHAGGPGRGRRPPRPLPAARAGYDIDDAAAFWKRLAETYPPSVLNGYNANHPALARAPGGDREGGGRNQGQARAKKPLLP